MKKLLAVFATFAIALGTAVAGEYEDISIAELNEAIKEGKVTILDVNGTKTYSKAHIPGAIDYRAKKSEIATLLPEDKDQLIVAYCGGPSCSAYKAGAKAAEDLGYTNVKHLSLGISGWLAENQPTEKADDAS